MDGDLYKALLADASDSLLSQANLSSRHGTETLVKKFSAALTKAAEIAAPYRKTGARRVQRTRNDRIAEAERLNKMALHAWKKAGKPANQNHSTTKAKKVAKKELRRHIRIEAARQRNEVRNKIMQARERDSKLFYSLIKQQRKSTNTYLSEINVGDTKFSGQDICKGWEKHFTQLAKPAPNQHFHENFTTQAQFDVDIIQDLCVAEAAKEPPLSFSLEEVKTAIKELNTGKAQDGSGLQVEHILYGGEEAAHLITQILCAAATQRAIPQCLKHGLLSPIYKRKGDKKISTNYRGITVMPVLFKVLEILLRKHLKKITDPLQSRLQRGFTANASPLHCALLLQEILLQARAKKQPIYIAFLDAKSAFDVVSHNNLNRKLYKAGVGGALWSLLRDLNQDATSAVKWEGAMSDPFPVLQGVRQGGVLSTELYKIYINDLLERLGNSGLGARIGTLRVPAPTCADDVALIAETEEELAALISMAVDYSNREQYVLQPTKSVIMPVSGSERKEITSSYKFDINGTDMPVIQQTSHMGILRSAKKQNQTAIADNIRKGRQAAYALMGPGLHGRNGLDPLAACHLIKVYVLPVLLYGLEILQPSCNQLLPLERFQKKLLKQVLSLPNNTSNAGVYTLTGFLPVEAEVHKRILSLFGSIMRQPGSLEHDIAVRQICHEGFSHNSWFGEVRKLLATYDLPSGHQLLSGSMSKGIWKALVKKAIHKYWRDLIRNDVAESTSLKYLHNDGYLPSIPHVSIVTTAPNTKDVTRLPVKLRLLTGTYQLQYNKKACNQNDVNPTCPLCGSAPETPKHFLLECCALQERRMQILPSIHAAADDLLGGAAFRQLSQEEKMQLLMDASALISTDRERMGHLEFQSRLHCERKVLLSTL